jgi:hypothetical protein
MIKGRTVLSSLTVVLVLAFASVCSSQPRYDHKVEQWGLEEIVLQSSQHYKPLPRGDTLGEPRVYRRETDSDGLL